MKNTIFIVFSLVLIVYISSCTNRNEKSVKQQGKKYDSTKVSYIHEDDVQAKLIMSKGARIAKLATLALGTKLNKVIADSGAKSAISFCNHNAMIITDSLATAESVTIRRLAKKNRNPLNETDPIESKIFKQYVVEWLSGTTLKSKIAIDNNGHPVFYKPIMINKNCLTCHGKPGETMPQNIASIIKELYPDDKAINFKDKQPRGMWAVTFDRISLNKK